MIGVDTNVLLRLATNDNRSQVLAIAAWLHEHAQDEMLFVNQVVLAESIWTLKSAYGYGRDSLSLFVETLLGNAAFEIEQAGLVEDALQLFRAGKADFADCLIFAKNARVCRTTITFDRAARELPQAALL